LAAHANMCRAEQRKRAVQELRYTEVEEEEVELLESVAYPTVTLEQMRAIARVAPGTMGDTRGATQVKPRAMRRRLPSLVSSNSPRQVWAPKGRRGIPTFGGCI